MILGQDDSRRIVESTAELRATTRVFARQARHRLDVLTPDLEPGLYDDEAFIEAVKDLALTSSRARLRFLVGDSRTAVTRGHRLTELARKLTSRIEVRRRDPMPGEEGVQDAFLLADAQGFVHRLTVARVRATVCFHDPLRVKELRLRFDELWEAAAPDPELRRLHL